MSHLYNFYKESIKDTKYVLLHESSFEQLLSKTKHLVHETDGKIDGLLLYGTTDAIYINLTLGPIEILRTLINELIDISTLPIKIHFNQVVKLQWYVDHTHIHPNYQGVIYNSPLHKLYQELGFIETSIQDTYLCNLETFVMPKEITNNLETLAKEGYEVTYYDKLIHRGMDNFLTKLSAKSFSDAIITNELKPIPDPLLIVSHNKEVSGFAGPLSVSHDNRGVFYGIEITGDVQGKGLGKALFNILCFKLKSKGAKYMTLFTGRENKAKYIYMSAGFKKVESFALMVYKK